MDDSIRTATPESVDLVFEPAGAGSRFVAAVIDGLIQGALIAALSFTIPAVLGVAGAANSSILEAGMGVGLAVLLISGAAVLFLYQMFFELLWKGQTPGKRALGLRVLQADGRPADYVQIVGRNLMRIVDFLPALYSAGVLTILLTRHNQRLGDLVAGTVVVREGRAARFVLAVPELNRTPTVSPALLRERLSRLQDGDLEPVRAFLARRWDLPEAVRRDLARRMVQALCSRMDWQQPVTQAEEFLEEVLWVRTGGSQAL